MGRLARQNSTNVWLLNTRIPDLLCSFQPINDENSSASKRPAFQRLPIYGRRDTQVSSILRNSFLYFMDNEFAC